MLRHGLFVEYMWTKNGGNGSAFVPAVFVDLLHQEGIAKEQTHALLVDNPRRLLTD